MACKMVNHVAQLLGFSKLRRTMPNSRPLFTQLPGFKCSGAYIRPIATSSVKQEQPSSDASMVEVDKSGSQAPAPQRSRRFDSPISTFETWYPFSPSRNVRQVMDEVDRFGDWDSFSPARNFRQMMDAMDRFFDASFFGFPSSPTSFADVGRGFRGGWEAAEDEEAYYVRLALPGFGKGDVEVSIEDDELVIKGERSAEEGDEKWTSTNNYRRYHSRVDIPEDVQTDQIKAQLKNGFLTVTLPKIKGQENKQIIDVQVE